MLATAVAATASSSSDQVPTLALAGSSAGSHASRSTNATALARISRTLRGFEVPQGECAGVAHHDNWEDETTGAPFWNYRIKVFPWRVFEVVTVRFRPPVSVDHLWAANLLSNEVQDDEQVITVELGHKSQDDFTFAIDGTGGPIKHTTISCANTEEPISTCGLEPDFTILNNYNGIISPKIHMGTWQVGASVDLTFREPISVGQAWGAELVGEPEDDDEDGMASPSTGFTLRFRLLPLSRGLPPERKDSFGFEASPPFHSMPTISCILRQRLPPPPPPSPPSPSPPPPQRKLVDEHECFLGGRMAFVKPPSTVGMPWRIDVTLVKWEPDVLLTLNFVGDSAHELEGHPLQIDSVNPRDAVWEDAITKHSVTYRLRPVMGDDPGALHIIAYGKITGLGQVTCCCAPPPPPPPDAEPPPPLPPPPSPRPQPPPPPPYDHLTNIEIAGSEMARPPPPALETEPGASSVGSSTQTVLLSVLGAMLLYFYGSKWLKQLQEHLRFTRMKKDVQKRFGPGGEQVPVDDIDDIGDYGAEADGMEVGWGGKKVDAKQKGARTTASPMLSMQLTSERSHEVALRMGGIKSMKQLQAMVLQEWCAAGGDRQESLMMELIDASGEAVKVSKTTDVNAVSRAVTLSLLPKRLRNTKAGRVARDNALDGVVEDGSPSRQPRAAGGGLD